MTLLSRGEISDVVDTMQHARNSGSPIAGRAEIMSIAETPNGRVIRSVYIDQNIQSYMERLHEQGQEGIGTELYALAASIAEIEERENEEIVLSFLYDDPRTITMAEVYQGTHDVVWAGFADTVEEADALIEASLQAYEVMMETNLVDRIIGSMVTTMKEVVKHNGSEAELARVKSALSGLYEHPVFFSRAEHLAGMFQTGSALPCQGEIDQAVADVLRTDDYYPARLTLLHQDIEISTPPKN